jgi:hypothetical protein
VSASSGAPRRPGPEWHRSDAFGLIIESDWPLPGSRPAGAERAGGLSAAPVTRVTQADSAVFDEAWTADAERLLEYRAPDRPGAAVSFIADRASEHYRFWAEDFGRYLVSADGGTVACERGAVGREQHERFVLAHALPVAAILRGFEVLHVSAVAPGTGATAFAGPSGTGKTRLAGRLVARGAGFLTDDVLAVKAAGDQVLAHPGPAFMTIRPDDAAMLAEVGGRLGAAAGSSDKVHVSLPARAEVTALRVIYHLAWGDTFAIAPVQGGDLNRVLALSFVPYLTTPDRLLRHLTIAQLVSAGAAQFRLQTPPGDLSDEQLETLEAHMRDAGA